MKLTTTCKAVLATAVCLAAIPASASAATIDMPGGVAPGDDEDLIYEAAGGESNDVLITTEVVGSRVEFIVNDVVPIEVVGEGVFDCNHSGSDLTRVQCRPETDGFKEVIVRLGNGVNRLLYTGSVPMTATGVGAIDNHFTGGPGRDRLFGDTGSDTLLGRGGIDELHGGGGDDRLAGESGGDLLLGGAGSDELINGPGPDVVRGDSGVDTVDYSFGTGPVRVNIDDAPNDGAAGEGDNIKADVETVKGTAGNDELIDTLGTGNTFLGLAGNDVIKGGPGADLTLVGGPGNDTIDGGAGNDMAFGNDGDDTMTGGADNDLVMGEAGQDTINNGPGADVMGGGADFDVVSYSASTQRITADIGGAAGGDGAAGEGDTISGDVEQLMGGAASDTLSGDDDANLILGLDGNDVIEGRGGADGLQGGNDNDTVKANDGVKDSVNCGADVDQVDADALDAPVACEGAAAPAVGIELARKRVDARGRARVNLHCWASSAQFCTGKLQLTRGKRVIGVAEYDVAAGDEETVRVRVGKRDRKLKVKAVTWAADATSLKWKSQRTLTIGAAR